MEENLIKIPAKQLVGGGVMPCINFGTGSLKNCTQSVINAIKAGMRAIDAAQSYGNEEEVGEAIDFCIRNGIVKREDLFIVTKLNVHKPISYDIAKESYFESLKKLKIDYADQYLFHGPNFTPGAIWKKLNAEVWKAFEDLYEEGYVKSIGVSNFLNIHLEELLKTARIKPMINQLELHPFWQQKEEVEFCKRHQIALSCAYSLVLSTQNENPVLVEIANKYNKTVPNILLKWSLQKGYMPIFKTTNQEHLKENLRIFDFEISAEDMEKIDSLNSNPIGGCGGSCPDSWYNVYSMAEYLNTHVDKIHYKLFGRHGINFMTVKRTDDGNQYYYFFGIPFIKKVHKSYGYKIYLFEKFCILNAKVTKVCTFHRIPKYKKGELDKYK